jgi:putative membrane protein
MPTIPESIAGLPAFLEFFFAAVALLLLFAFVYSRVTPYNEIPLIRKGNVAAAIGFGGALLGYCLPLAGAVVRSASLEDLLAWGAIALIVQLSVLGVARLLIPGLFDDMNKGRVASAVLLAVISLSAGLLNTASMG